jgi:large subunit ribosomal protein L32
MGLPKRRHSKTRGRWRRTHYVLTARTLTKCTNCGAKILPHHICYSCGYYKGKPVVVKKEKKKKDKTA